MMRDENFNSEEDMIRELEEQERQAVLKQDLTALERLWSEEFIVNNPQNQISKSRGDVLAFAVFGTRIARIGRTLRSFRFFKKIPCSPRIPCTKRGFGQAFLRKPYMSLITARLIEGQSTGG